MTTFADKVTERFKQGNICIRLIYINTIIYVLCVLVETTLYLLNKNSDVVYSSLGLPASLGKLLKQPWSIVTYFFVHDNLPHLLFNMLWLYWIGGLFLEMFSTKHLRGVYILGGLIGGVLYMVAYNIFPLFAQEIDQSFLIGASASVLAITCAAAYRQPNRPIRLSMAGTFRLKHLAVLLVCIDLFLVKPANIGGHIAHIGGIIAGIMFAACLGKGYDLTGWINKIIDATAYLFSYKRQPKVYKDPKQQPHPSTDIDSIVEKLRKNGYQGLSAEEKEQLFKASKRK